MAIEASLPSGADDVVEARAELEACLAEAGTLPTFGCEPHDLGPCVHHMKDGQRAHRPDAVFVGDVCGAADVSPWSRPLLASTFSDSAEFAQQRVDLRSFCVFLRGKVLVCD